MGKLTINNPLFHGGVRACVEPPVWWAVDRSGPWVGFLFQQRITMVLKPGGYSCVCFCPWNHFEAPKWKVVYLSSWFYLSIYLSTYLSYQDNDSTHLTRYLIVRGTIALVSGASKQILGPGAMAAMEPPSPRLDENPTEAVGCWYYWL